MNSFLKSLLSLLICWSLIPASAQTPTIGDANDLPFTFELEEITQNQFPGLHSFAFGKWEGWWIVIGGRINGLHGFFPFTAFPETGANVEIRLMDPDLGLIHSYPIDSLVLTQIDPLKSTNPQYTQRGEWLYITGGYGKTDLGDFITFPVLTAVHLPALVSKILAGENPSSAFRQLTSPYMQVCGGEMDYLEGHFYLVGGHDFAGNYTQSPSSQFTQEYTYEIRKFDILHEGDSLSIQNYSAYHDENQLRRRDFSLAPIMQPNGKPALGLYGGVFRPNVELPYYHPVFMTNDEIFEVDTTYEQVFSQYTCPTIPLYDSTDQTMYTVFCGGLSVHYYDTDDDEVKYDDRVPFVKDITVLRKRANGDMLEYLLPHRFDELLGSNMLFVSREEAPHYENEVFKLRAMEGRTFVGYLFGGIKAEIPNITPSSASNRMFKVFIQPKSGVGIDGFIDEHSAITVFPNPYTRGETLQIEMEKPIQELTLFHANGMFLQSFEKDLSALNEWLLHQPSGIYFLRVNGRMVKLVIGT